MGKLYFWSLKLKYRVFFILVFLKVKKNNNLAPPLLSIYYFQRVSYMYYWPIKVQFYLLNTISLLLKQEINTKTKINCYHLKKKIEGPKYNILKLRIKSKHKKTIYLRD